MYNSWAPEQTHQQVLRTDARDTKNDTQLNKEWTTGLPKTFRPTSSGWMTNCTTTETQTLIPESNHFFVADVTNAQNFTLHATSDQLDLEKPSGCRFFFWASHTLSWAGSFRTTLTFTKSAAMSSWSSHVGSWMSRWVQLSRSPTVRTKVIFKSFFLSSATRRPGITRPFFLFVSVGRRHGSSRSADPPCHGPTRRQVWAADPGGSGREFLTRSNRKCLKIRGQNLINYHMLYDNNWSSCRN